MQCTLVLYHGDFMKIFIAVPTFENISPETFKSIYGLDRGGHWVVFDYVRGYDCATARNNIAKQAIAEEADYVLMIDSDILIPGDAIINFLDDPKDVCLGFSAHRNAENIYTGLTSMCRLGPFDYVDQYTGKEVIAMRESGQYKIQIHGGGMGSAFIKTDVFKRIEYPYFKWTEYDNGGVLSEDLWFCEQCRKAGIPIFADTRVCNGHIFRHIQGVE